MSFTWCVLLAYGIIALFRKLGVVFSLPVTTLNAGSLTLSTVAASWPNMFSSKSCLINYWTPGSFMTSSDGYWVGITMSWALQSMILSLSYETSCCTSDNWSQNCSGCVETAFSLLECGFYSCYFVLCLDRVRFRSVYYLTVSICSAVSSISNAAFTYSCILKKR